MFAGDVRHVIDELDDGIGSLELRPLEAAQGREVAAKADARQASREWPRNAGVQSVARTGGVEITWQGGLVQAVIADARFVDPADAGDPRPASTHHLGAGVNIRPPSRLKFGKVLGGSRS